MKHEELTGQIIQCAYRVHNTLGFGFLEAVYQNALAIELNEIGLKAVKEMPIQIYYNGQIVGEYVADILVNDLVILELKWVKEVARPQRIQLINYKAYRTGGAGNVINSGERVEIKRKILTSSLI